MSNHLPSNERNDKSEPFVHLFQSMNDFFREKPIKGFLQHMDDFFAKPLLTASFPVDLTENNQEHIIRAELPGVKKQQIDLSILENNVIISIRHEEIITEENANKQIIYKKQAYNHQSRTISLPYLINERKVTAYYQDGVLEVRVPKEKGKNIKIE